MFNNQKHHIIVGISGGVDSSVAALLLKDQGYKVEGLFMKNWEEDDTKTYCSATQDRQDAEQVCDKLDIQLHTVNLSAEYWKFVFCNFLEEYKVGRTPNPDILCNREIKFKAFLDYAQHLGADLIATGHYANITRKGTNYSLLKGKDLNKDQSYFLYTLNQNQLKHAIFPIADYLKKQIRKIAQKAGFFNHQKKDSTGICFIGEKKFKQFLQRYIPVKHGDIVTLTGKKLGIHDGIMFYTIGQRQGIGIGGQSNSTNDPWYVLEKKLNSNELVVVQGKNNPALFKQRLITSKLHWIAGNQPSNFFSCKAKIRYRQVEQHCHVELKSIDKCQVTFQIPQRAITPGQSIVFYNDAICLGGGIIEKDLKTLYE